MYKFHNKMTATRVLGLFLSAATVPMLISQISTVQAAEVAKSVDVAKELRSLLDEQVKANPKLTPNSTKFSTFKAGSDPKEGKVFDKPSEFNFGKQVHALVKLGTDKPVNEAQVNLMLTSLLEDAKRVLSLVEASEAKAEAGKEKTEAKVLSFSEIMASEIVSLFLQKDTYALKGMLPLQASVNAQHVFSIIGYTDLAIYGEIMLSVASETKNELARAYKAKETELASTFTKTTAENATALATLTAEQSQIKKDLSEAFDKSKKELNDQIQSAQKDIESQQDKPALKATSEATKHDLESALKQKEAEYKQKMADADAIVSAKTSSNEAAQTKLVAANKAELAALALTQSKTLDELVGEFKNICWLSGNSWGSKWLSGFDREANKHYQRFDLALDAKPAIAANARVSFYATLLETLRATSKESDASKERQVAALEQLVGVSAEDLKSIPIEIQLRQEREKNKQLLTAATDKAFAVTPQPAAAPAPAAVAVTPVVEKPLPATPAVQATAEPPKPSPAVTKVTQEVAKNFTMTAADGAKKKTSGELIDEGSSDESASSGSSSPLSQSDASPSPVLLQSPVILQPQGVVLGGPTTLGRFPFSTPSSWAGSSVSTGNGAAVPNTLTLNLVSSIPAGSSASLLPPSVVSQSVLQPTVGGQKKNKRKKRG